MPGDSGAGRREGEAGVMTEERQGSGSGGYVIVTAVMGAYVCAYLQTDQTVHFSMCSLLHVNYISVKICKFYKIISKNKAQAPGFGNERSGL